MRFGSADFIGHLTPLMERVHESGEGLPCGQLPNGAIISLSSWLTIPQGWSHTPSASRTGSVWSPSRSDASTGCIGSPRVFVALNAITAAPSKKRLLARSAR
jgi:hypothetical protein